MFAKQSTVLYNAHVVYVCILFLLLLELGVVRRKTLVLDLDETLIHSHHDGVIRQPVNPGTPPDFVLKVRTLDL